MPAPPATPSRRTSRTRRLALCVGAVALATVMGGCEIDGWLGDPSVIGRWEHTPTIVPILDRIDAIEADSGEFVDITDVTPDDLVPKVSEYVLSPGDFLRVTVFGLFQVGVPYVAEINVNENGRIDIPDVGRVLVAGRTSFEVREDIIRRLLDLNRFNEEPIVDVQALSRQDATYSVFGAIQNPGRFGIPRPDHRLLEAITNAGGVSPVIKEVFVIRQVPLSDAVAGTTSFDEPQQPTNGTGRPNRPGNIRPTPTRDGDADANSLIELLDDIAGEGEDNGASDAPEQQPGLISPSVLDERQPYRPRTTGAMPGVYQDADDTGLADGDEPAIDLEDDALMPPNVNDAPVMPLDEPEAPALDQGEWRFINGRWIRVMPVTPQDVEQLPEGDDPLSGDVDASDLVTQRVIGIPTGPLLQGVARYNIVIRPGDIIHVPSPRTGLVYAMGPGINRPGTYNIPANGKLTIIRLIATGGGLSAISVPERVDLTRIVGDDRQATIRLNARAIVEGTHPDVELKPDDIVNFGTDFWATPYAVVRNAFRFSYGFGFLLDRNFGNDVFGAPPSSNGFFNN